MFVRSGFRLTVAGAVTALAIGTSASGQEPGYRPSGAKRQVAAYTFEEIAPDPVPKDWYRAHSTEEVHREGFPAFNKAEQDTSVAHTGAASLKLPCAGGSVSCRLQHGTVPVFAGADYSISAHVRTLGVRNTRAIMTVRFLDEKSRPIPGSEQRTLPMITHGEWLPVNVQLVGIYPDAAELQIDLELLQPRQFHADPVLGDDHVWPEDFDGTAWFDDVFVHQLPRVELYTSESPGVYEANESPELRLLVRDLVGETLQGDTTVFDLDGNEVDRTVLQIDPTGVTLSWTPRLPRHGWYEATLSVRSGDGEIGATRTSFVWLGARTGPAPGPETRRFGLIADRIDPAHLNQLPALSDASGSGFVHLWAWHADDRSEDFETAVSERKPVLDTLMQRGRDLTFVLPDLPDEVVDRLRLGSASPIQLGRLPEDVWRPFLIPLLTRFGQRISRWQVDVSGSESAFWDQNLDQTVLLMNRVMERLVPSGLVALPWPASLEVPEGSAASSESQASVDALTITYPVSFGPSTLADYVRDYVPSESRRELTLAFELPDLETSDRRTRVTTLAQRTVEAWAALGEPPALGGAARLAVDHPWTSDRRRRSRVLPEAELAAWRTLAHHLAGRRVIAELPTAPGTRCYVLAEQEPVTGRLSRGALVAWNNEALPEDAFVDAYLGTAVRTAVDLFGNAHTLSSGADGSFARVPLTESPVFLEGIDPYIAKFIASYEVVPDSVRPIQMQHVGAILLENPWPAPISGRLKIVNPRPDRNGSWDIDPSGIIQFNIPAREQQRIPITFSFGPAEEAGPKPFDAIVRVTLERELPPIRLADTVTLGLTDLLLDSSYLITTGTDGSHVIVIATITNAGETPRTLTLEVRPPPGVRIQSQRVSISNLRPGESVRKRFVFKNGAATLDGQRIRIRLDDPDQLVYLLKSIQIQQIVGASAGEKTPAALRTRPRSDEGSIGPANERVNRTVRSPWEALRCGA